MGRGGLSIHVLNAAGVHFLGPEVRDGDGGDFLGVEDFLSLVVGGRLVDDDLEGRTHTKDAVVQGLSHCTLGR